MANLLRFVLELATDESARTRFRADPDGCVGALDDLTEPLTGEDVDAAIDLVRNHLATIDGHDELSRRIDAGSPRGTGVGETPDAAAVRHLHAVCASIDGGEGPTDHAESRSDHDSPVAQVARPAAWGGDDEDRSGHQGEPVPLQPPGPPRPLLWAVSGGGRAEEVDDPDDDTSGPRVDPSHPVIAGELGPGPLEAVPEPDGGFDFDPLELVVVVEDIPDTDVEAGSLATVVAVHRDADIGLRYEIEVADEHGRRFLGLVEPHVLGRPD